MTDEQRQQIKMLRYQGYGYKQITSEVGLSRDSVRGYCIRNGLHEFGTSLAKEYKQVMQKDFYLFYALIVKKNCRGNMQRGLLRVCIFTQISNTL